MAADTRTLIDLVGWIGAATLLAAYFLVSTKRVGGDAIIYQTMNLIGSVCLIVNTLFYGAYPSSGVNLVWMGIAIYAIASQWLKSRGAGSN
jgi:hypothetical protein